MEEKEKNKRIKNVHYRQFLDKGIIKTIQERDIEIALNKVEYRHRREGRALIICLYYTGARPVEVLNIKAKHIKREKNYIIIETPASKNGLPRSVYLPFKKPLVKELFRFACGLMPERYMFWNFKGRYIRKVMTRKGVKEYIEETNRIKYYFQKWFSSLEGGAITPYHLRHNRFSKLAQSGATMDELRVLKGAKTYASIMPYIHMSTAQAKKVARRID